MSALVLTPRPGFDGRLDLSALRPTALTGLSEHEIARLPLSSAGPEPEGRGLVVADVFAIRPGDAGCLVIAEGSDRFDGIGEGLDGGEIRVEGHVGHRAGRAMQNGVLTIAGNAGPHAGSCMSGGRIAIAGHAGAFLGGPLAGEMIGMRGGEILVDGDAAERAGDRMRRGTIRIGGNAGPQAGARMIAGSLIVLGRHGPGLGQLMRRGTILLPAGSEEGLPASFVDNGACEFTFLALMERLVPGVPPLPRRMRRFLGDMASLGLGEVLVPLAR